MAPPVQPVGPRFWAKVDKGGECWVWTAGLNHEGYGKFWLNGRTIAAHRVAYILTSGPIPEGLTIDHLCRVRACVRPDHLEAVTIQENLARAPLALGGFNARKTHCPQGHAYDEANTRVRPDGRRLCRSCDRARSAQRWAKQRAVA